MSDDGLSGAPGRPSLPPISADAAPPIGPPAFAVQQVQVWQGQFPPPEAMERYEAISPGTFDRLLLMAERQQQAAIESTAEARKFQRADNQRGQYLGFVVTLVAIAGAVYCALHGQGWIAAALVGVPVLSVAKALIDSARARPTFNEADADAAQSEEEQPRLPF